MVVGRQDEERKIHVITVTDLFMEVSGNRRGVGDERVIDRNNLGTKTRGPILGSSVVQGTSARSKGSNFFKECPNATCFTITPALYQAQERAPEVTKDRTQCCEG